MVPVMKCLGRAFPAAVLFLALILVMAEGWADASEAATQEEVAGKWIFHKLFYQNHFMDPPNPDLKLVFEFSSDGEDRIHWSRTGQKGYCDRKGRYQLEQGLLKDTITWVNPQNDSSCASDPDMQIGRHTETPAELKNGEFWLHLTLADEGLVYIFKRTDP